MKIIIDNKIPFIKGVLEPFAKVIYLEGSKICNSDLTDADALIVRTRTRVNRSLLDGTKVKFVGTATIGTDHIDTIYCDSNGIDWRSAPGCNSESVMQYVLASLSLLANRYNLTLKEKTIGIIGVGNVGSKVADACEILGMTVLRNDPPRERREGKRHYSSLEYLVPNSDIISLHVPLINESRLSTFHMVNSDFLSKIKRGCIIINTSRGPIIKEESLIENIHSNHLKGSVLDVWENEPDINYELVQLADIATPHIAGYSVDGKANGTRMIINQLAHFFNLPIKEWKPENIPVPDNPVIDNTLSGRCFQDITTDSILKTYPIEDDSDLLKKTPQRFEELRGNYRNRRDFNSYTITGDNNTTETLKKLGFKTL